MSKEELEFILEPAEVRRLLQRFFCLSGDMVDVDWEEGLDGEELLLRVSNWDTDDAKVETITYLTDRVTQLAPPRTFDPIRCASAITQALHQDGRQR